MVEEKQSGKIGRKFKYIIIIPNVEKEPKKTMNDPRVPFWLRIFCNQLVKYNFGFFVTYSRLTLKNYLKQLPAKNLESGVSIKQVVNLKEKVDKTLDGVVILNIS